MLLIGALKEGSSPWRPHRRIDFIEITVHHENAGNNSSLSKQVNKSNASYELRYVSAWTICSTSKKSTQGTKRPWPALGYSRNDGVTQDWYQVPNVLSECAGYWRHLTTAPPRPMWPTHMKLSWTKQFSRILVNNMVYLQFWHYSLCQGRLTLMPDDQIY